MKQPLLLENNANTIVEKNTQWVEGSVHLLSRIPLMS